MEVTCMTCKKEYIIDFKDKQYNKIKSGKSKLYVCKTCNEGVQRESIKTTGISPNDVDEYGKYLK
ncbi:DUF2197 domain-containing protein [Filobacillus milosensis]|uniref:DUF2197 domain-containing protein n=1 Tax=Filobacillus milosensis TaxID=94137 RepID=A0A4Y8ISX0_9BACI|nr:DUF2197 domain-containing protein [Filobacillus milosensis]TFB23887.1 DUF2197 domain-containing protein [Filobacillus milosensis]